jgi:hypothetical protein
MMLTQVDLSLILEHDPIRCKRVVDGLELVKQCGILSYMFEGSSTEATQYVISLYEAFMSVQTTQDPLWISYCGALLRLSLSDSSCHQSLWRYLLVRSVHTYPKQGGHVHPFLIQHLLLSRILTT